MRADVFLWRKVDSPGHDACRLFNLPDGYRLSGTAVFADSVRVYQLTYEILADRTFRTRSARVEGYLGKKSVALRIRAQRSGRWQVNGAEQPQLRGCLDLDLGFTPATNLLAIRRLSLRVGQEADAPAAYVAFPKMKLVVLPQHYKRIARYEYVYEAPSFGYRGTLRVSAAGAVLQYPGLFEIENQT